MQKTLKASLLALLFGATQVICQCNNQTFLVIGAGISGLGAANYLREKNCTVTVLEARGRLGGRLNTEVMGASNIKVDMGASWIHGIGPGAGDLEEYKDMENPLYTIAKANKISTIATWVDEEAVEEKSYWWKGTTTPLSQSKVTTISDGIRTHVKGKKSSATQSQTV
jgi:monoamine oxidase